MGVGVVPKGIDGSGFRFTCSGRKSPARVYFWFPLLVLVAGCTGVEPQHQRLVSKANMEFTESVVFGYENKLAPEVEPGSAFAGGAQSSGCTSCK